MHPTSLPRHFAVKVAFTERRSCSCCHYTVLHFKELLLYLIINVLKVTVLIRDAQIPGVRSILSRGAQYLRALSMELASCHPPGAWNYEVASIFLEHLHTPGVNNWYLRCGYKLMIS
jgi:hypothetical protein